MRYCGGCGRPVGQLCQGCSQPNPTHHRHCGYCGVVLRSSTSRPEPIAERRLLTVMFCDLVDSTRLSGELDPESLRQVVLRYQELCVEAIEQRQGYVAQYLGDGIMAYSTLVQFDFDPQTNKISNYREKKTPEELGPFRSFIRDHPLLSGVIAGTVFSPLAAPFAVFYGYQLRE